MRSVSTFARRASIPSVAKYERFDPSKPNGRVTTPTVKAPSSLAICAITGAAPVPVPPPIPAVMKIISEPSRACDTVSADSSAARLPTSGCAPAPKPRVNFGPS